MFILSITISPNQNKVLQKKLIKPGPEESIAERKKLRRKRVNEVAKKRKDDKA